MELLKGMVVSNGLFPDVAIVIDSFDDRRVKGHELGRPEITVDFERDLLDGVWYGHAFVTPEEYDRLEARQLCPRTVCLYKPGVPMPGVYCNYSYRGSMPCTGPLVCNTCGGRAES